MKKLGKGYMGFLLTIYFLYILIVDYKRGIVSIAVVFQLLSYLGTGIEGVKIFSLLSAIALVLYFLIPTAKRKRFEPYPRPLIYASLVFLCSFVVSEIFTRNTTHHWATIAANVITYFAFPYILWKCLDTRAVLLSLLDNLYILMLIACCCGIFEIICGRNYIYECIGNIFTLEDFSFDDLRVRFGLKRCNSIFSYFTTYGVACCFSFTVFFFMQFVYGIKKKWLILLVVAMPFCAFSTGSRAIMLGLFCIICFIFGHESLRHTKVFRRMISVIIILSPILVSLLIQVFYSMVNSEDYSGGGSTSELREMQWAECLPAFWESPFIGNGRMYIWDEIAPHSNILKGAESIWFSILVDYGILGAFAYLNLLFVCGFLLWKVDKRLICVPIAYLLILSLSPDGGVQYNILITFSILHIKMKELLSNVSITKKQRYNAKD